MHQRQAGLVLKSVMICSLMSSFFWTPQASAGQSYHVMPPFDVDAVRLKTGKKNKKPFSCAQPPAPMEDLHMESFYEREDGSFSVIDPTAHAAYKKASKPASVFEIGMASMANRYVRSNPPRKDMAVCVLDWLTIWAEGNALLGDVNKNGEYTRKWLLGSIATAWMQIRHEPSLDPVKQKTVISWIRKVAKAAKADFSRDEQLPSRQNNHLYWAAWGVGAAGMAIDDAEMFAWAISKARLGINNIRADGVLPLELARGQRAYLYHLFAAMPLFMLANAAQKNGIDLFQQNDHALRRLAELCLKNLGRARDFQQMTGKKQDLTHVGTASDLGWVEIYRQRYQDPLADTVLKNLRPMKQSRFGGNITLLYSQVMVKPSKKL